MASHDAQKRSDGEEAETVEPRHTSGKSRFHSSAINKNNMVILQIKCRFPSTSKQSFHRESTQRCSVFKS